MKIRIVSARDLIGKSWAAEDHVRMPDNHTTIREAKRKVAANGGLLPGESLHDALMRIEGESDD